MIGGGHCLLRSLAAVHIGRSFSIAVTNHYGLAVIDTEPEYHKLSDENDLIGRWKHRMFCNQGSPCSSKNTSPVSNRVLNTITSPTV